MTVKYYLTLNDLTPDPDDYRAVVQVDETKTVEQVVDRMVGRGSTVTKAEALSTLEEYYSALAEILKEGSGIRTPAYAIAPKIKGVFYKADRFDKSKHKLSFRLLANERLNEVLPKVKLEKVKAVEHLPVLAEYQDAASDTINGTLTPAESACIKGENLRYDAKDAQQGIFFVAANGVETRVKTVLRNMPSELIFTVPATLKKGNYSLKVRNIVKESRGLKEATLAVPLTVV